MRVLSLNRGSSSLKFALHDAGDGERRRAGGMLEGIGGGEGRLRVHDERTGATRETGRVFGDARAAVAAVFEALDAVGLSGVEAIGHRVVHGGPEHVAPERVDDALLGSLRAITPFAPLHLPPAIAVIEAVARSRAELPQVVCFDTAFHQRMPEIARRLPLRRDLWDAGVRRYGFHGLSYESVLASLGEERPARLVIAHLGNGSSLAAVRDGCPVDTTMGLTPTGGCMMGTRSGDLDPGVLLHLLREERYDVAALDRVVNRDAGLLGVSGLSADMRELLAARATSPHADEAVAMFCRSVAKQVGALAVVLGGLDLLVFTGGIGEHAAPVRLEIGRRLEHLGVAIDEARNASSSSVAADGAACGVRIVPADEERMIARHTAARLAG